MYNFSGIWYKILGTFGLMVLMAIIIILFEKPWSKSFNIKKCKFAIVAILIAVSSSIFYTTRIISPDVSSYTGTYVESHRTFSYASPLPFNYKYVFWNGEGKKPMFYLDAFSKKEVCPDGFEEGNTYTVYYDEWTNIIVAVEANQGTALCVD